MALPEVHPALQPVVAPIVQVVKGADPAAPTTQELAALIAQQASIINAQSVTIQQQQQALNAIPNATAQAVATALTQYTTGVVQPLINGLIGGSLPGSLDTLAELVAQIQSDETGVAAMLASLNTLATRVTTAESTLLGKATTTALATETSRINTLLTTTVPALQADTASRLLRTGDVATGSIMVPTAAVPAAAPRLDQTYGGLNAPIRFATAVGAAAVAMLPGPLTDPTPQGRKAKPYQVVLTMRSAPAVGATITVGTTSGGADVFTKSYLLAALPGLNAVLAPMQPIFIELPAGTTLYAKATAGTWDVEVFSYYKS